MHFQKLFVTVRPLIEGHLLLKPDLGELVVDVADGVESTFIFNQHVLKQGIVLVDNRIVFPEQDGTLLLGLGLLAVIHDEVFIFGPVEFIVFADLLLDGTHLLVQVLLVADHGLLNFSNNRFFVK